MIILKNKKNKKQITQEKETMNTEINELGNEKQCRNEHSHNSIF